MNKLWQNRIKHWETNYKQWSNQFKCNILEDYYEGRQWRFNNYFTSDPYVVNLVYSTIKIKAANLLLSYPKYLITPKPGNSDYNQEEAMQSAQLKEDALNTVISDDREAFSNACHLVFLDSMFRFGVMEVGYASEWLRNPLAHRPLLNNQVVKVGKDDPEVPNDKPKIVQMPDDLPDTEKIYFKRIPATRFRVGTKDAQELDRCDYVGYYEFLRKADLKVIKGIKSEYLENARTFFTDEVDPVSTKLSGSDKDDRETGELIKVWHAWDLRSKKRLLIFDSPCEVVWEDDFKRLPIMDLRWDLRLKGWYPIPPVFQWVSPQNEYNESREMLRSHRKRFIRKFQIVGDEIDQEEIDKFTNGEDGTCIKVPRADAIKAIDNPSLDSSAIQSLQLSKDDFNEVSGTSSADRGRADRTTATESQRLGMKADIRDSAEDANELAFYKKCGREALLLMRERFTEGVWAKVTSDTGEDFLGEVQINPAYKWVSSENLDDGYDFKIDVEVISASPLRNEEEEKKFLKFLSYVQNFPQISLSPLLVREAAYRAGYRNEKVIREMQKMAQLTMLGAVNQAQGAAQAGTAGSNTGQNALAKQMQTPNQSDTANQIQQQLQ